MSVLRRPLHSGSSKLKLILIVGIMALLGAGGVYVLYGQPMSADSEESSEDGEESSEHPVSPAVVYEIGNFLVNVRTNDELRYLRVEVAAAIRDYSVEESGGGHGGGGDNSNKELPSLKSEDEAVARDLIVRILSDASFTSLCTAKGRDNAKEQIKQALCEMLEEAQVENVLFLSFVMQ